MAESWIEALPQGYRKRAVTCLEELIRRNSANPPGRELETAEYAAKVLQEAGLQVQLDEFEPGRCNVTATLGEGDEADLVFLGHLDVVPAEGEWQHGKFEPQEENGRIYGRGACDMKGGIAAMITAATALAASGKTLCGKILLLLDSDEENGNKGIHRLLSQGPIRAKSAIVGEPSDMKLLLGNKGYASVYVHTKGVSCHASQPEHGKNAIYQMAQAILRLEQYAEQISQKTAPHLGKATLSVGTIRGGTRINIVPDECVCEVERRVLPGETRESVFQGIQDLLDGVAEVTPRGTYTMPSLLETDHPFTKQTAAMMTEVLGKEPESGAFTGGTEAAYLSQFGIPTLIVGPGSLEQAHGVDEYVSVQQLHQCTDLYYRLMQKACVKPTASEEA